jgi:Leucine-rich repeat (LRR) protein
LKVVDLGANCINAIPQQIEKLCGLEDLWLNDNKIQAFDQVNHLIALKELRTLYLERNPLAR